MFCFDRLTRCADAHAAFNSIYGGDIPDVDRLYTDATTKAEFKDDDDLIKVVPMK